MNEQIMKMLGLTKQIEEVKQGICPNCHKPVNTKEFKNKIEKREFKISGLCAKCQREIFND